MRTQRLFSIKKSWETYWFSSVSSVGYALFRVVFGITLLLFHVPRLPYISDLYTRSGFIFPAGYLAFFHLPIPSLSVATILNWLLIAAIFCFIVGYRTRSATALILFLHLYFTWIERFSTKGFGEIMTIYLFLFLLAPAGSFLSIDFIRTSARKLTGKNTISSPLLPPRVSGTLQRLMLWQLALIYLFNVTSKFYFGGIGWFTGDHLAQIYYDYGDINFFARPTASLFFEKISLLLPLLGTLLMGTLLFIGLGLLFRKDRPYAIAAGVFYHSVTLLTTRVPPVFSFLMFSLYLIAIDPDQWETWWDRLRGYYAKKRARLFYDDTCALCRTTVSYVHAADMLGRIDCVGISSLSGDSITIGNNTITREKLLRAMHVFSSRGIMTNGFSSYRVISRLVPFFWPIAPVLYIPGARFLGEKIYGLIAKSRKNICLNCK